MGNSNNEYKNNLESNSTTQSIPIETPISSKKIENKNYSKELEDLNKKMNDHKKVRSKFQSSMKHVIKQHKKKI